jgi:hypothetical protein
MSLSRQGFWSHQHQRELLWTLKARWGEFSKKSRAKLEARIIRGPEKWPRESRRAWATRKAISAAIRLGWLEKEGCQLSPAAKDRLISLRRADPRWRAEWDAEADDSREGRIGWVATDTATKGLESVPLPEAAKLAREMESRQHLEFVHYEPFKGLVKDHTVRALSILGYELRHGRFEARLWQSLIESWPTETSGRFNCLLAALSAKLSEEQLSALRYYLPRWISGHLPKLLTKNPAVGWSLWDRICNALATNGEEAIKSGISKSSVGRVTLEESRRTLTHALNSPTGPLVEALVHSLNDLKRGKGSGIPPAFRDRFERAIALPGEGADHAVLTITQQLRWLDWLDPAWTREVLVPLFSPTNSFAEPAWAGYLTDTQLMGPSLFTTLKSSFLELFTASQAWSWESHSSERLADLLIVATNWGKTRRAYVSYAEARRALQEAATSVRHTVLWRLARIMAEPDGWKMLVKPFLERAWPREERFRTAEASSQMVDIATEADTDFPEVVSVVEDFVIPAERSDTTIFGLTRTEDGLPPLAERFPEHTLLLLGRLVPPSPSYPPYDLGNALSLISNAKPELQRDMRWRRLSELLA